MWFIAPVWFFVFRHFLSVPQIGINEIICFTIGLAAEIPSGALADNIGRRKTLIIGGVLLVIGAAGTAAAYSLMTLVIAQSVWFIGYAFYSGANDALVYDKLIEENREDDWAKISARKNNLVVLVTIASVLIGGLLYRVHYRLPFAVYTLAMVIFLLLVTRYPKDEKLKIINKSVHSAQEYWNNLKLGCRELLRPQLRFLLWGVLVFATLYYAYEWGVLRPLILSNQGYGGFSASILSFVVHIAMFALYIMLPRMFGKSVSEKTVLVGVVLASFSYLLLSFKSSVWLVGLIIVLFTITASTITWWTSIYINRHVGSSHRATALSTWAMLEKVPYIMLVGTITNLSSRGFSAFIIISGAAAGLLAIFTLVNLRRVDPTIE